MQQAIYTSVITLLEPNLLISLLATDRSELESVMLAV
jgi:hypothetical protein